MTISLGGYPAKQCPRVTHNKFSPSAPPEPEPAPELLALFEMGNEFEQRVTEELASALPRDELLVLAEDDWEENIARTLDAMRQKVPVIVNGRLPNVDGRSGAPDVMVQWRSGYLPADIKGHQTLSKARAGRGKSRSKVLLSSLGDPGKRDWHQGRSNKGGSWRDDAMQLSHYTRMLQALGLHAGGDNPAPETLIGAIIGTTDFEELLGDDLAFTWYDLAEMNQETFSDDPSSFRAKRSALQRYDHEFDFRLQVAEVAHSGGELVRPIGISECDDCVWNEYCASVVPKDDASFGIDAGKLKAREWLFLYPETGTLSMAELAVIDVEAVAQEFAQHSVGTRNSDQRLAAVVRRARMTVAGREIEPAAEVWPEVPFADVEVDYDIEWDRDGRIYQWGLRIREDQDEATARYEPVASFAQLDEVSELELANHFAAKINALAEQAETEGKSLTIYHWSHVELSKTRKFEAVAEALHGRTFDLLKWFSKHLFARGSSSIKSVAQVLGFAWSVDDPGGFFSQEMIEQARNSDAEAREWCLKYNESDVAAQAAIRDGLRDLIANDQR